jgi:hypothetical protein
VDGRVPAPAISGSIREMTTDAPRDGTADPGFAVSVRELLGQVSAERGLDFEPAPALVLEVLPDLTATVEGILERCHGAQDVRWVAAALAALAHQVQARSLDLS